MNTNSGAGIVIPFRQRTMSGKAADKARIISMYNTGQINGEQLAAWLKNGGHSCQKNNRSIYEK